MTRSLVVLLVLAGLVEAVPDGVEAPKGSAPQFAYLTAVDKDKETVTIQQLVEVPAQKFKDVKVQVVINGVVREETRKVAYIEMTTKQQESVLSFKNATAWTVEGQKLSKEDMWKRLAAKKTILMIPGGDGLDPAYRSVLQKDVLVVK